MRIVCPIFQAGARMVITFSAFRYNSKNDKKFIVIVTKGKLAR